MASDAGPQTFGGRLAQTAKRLPNKAAVVERDSTVRHAGLDADATAEGFDRERISVLHTVPTVYRETMNRLDPGRVLAHLRVIRLGGEAAFETDVDLFRRHPRPDCVLINQLGMLYARPVKRFEAATMHSQMLDVHNDAFALSLATCMNAIRRAQPHAIIAQPAN